ncbi:hypothetical protein FDP41_000301 [Naegleria fowleri]|uniref:Uncharacterized protein n=1 Tax=Naegleria fowleri TaxID=5763 RepID=A0A6A5CBH8_NAEFO|nr:uncharacterized protein FDP41_000301 [Naegleria fowleri]KAF0984402.1 hypothetical protein FDP41_000301 [Naegleria fowleri]
MGQTHSPPSSSRVMRVLPQHHSSSRIGSHSPQHLLSSIPPIEEENDSRKDEDSTFLCPRRSQEVSLSSSPKHSTSNHHNRTTTTTSPRLANRGGGYGGHGGMPQTISGSSHESHEEREGKWFSSVSSENFELKSPRGMMTMGHSSCMQHLKQKMIMMMVYGSNHVSYSDSILQYWMERYQPPIELDRIKNKIFQLCLQFLRFICLKSEASSEQGLVVVQALNNEKEKLLMEWLLAVEHPSNKKMDDDGSEQLVASSSQEMDEEEQFFSSSCCLSPSQLQKFDSEMMCCLERLWKSEYIQERFHSLMSRVKTDPEESIMNGSDMKILKEENHTDQNVNHNSQSTSLNGYQQYQESAPCQLCKHAEYFLNKVQEIVKHDYVWTIDDMTHAMQRNSRLNEVKLWYRPHIMNSSFIKNQISLTGVETIYSVLDITAIGGEKTKWLRSYSNVDGFLMIFSLDEISSDKHSLQTALHAFNEITQYFSGTASSSNNLVRCNSTSCRTQIYVCFTESNLFCDRVMRGEYALQKSLKGDARNPTTVFKFIVAQFMQSNGINGVSLSSNNLNKIVNNEHTSSPIPSKSFSASSPELLFFTVNDFSCKSDMYNFTEHLLEGKSYFEDRISGKKAKRDDELRKELLSMCVHFHESSPSLISSHRMLNGLTDITLNCQL